MDEEVMSDVAFRVGAVEQMRAGANVALLSRDLGVSRWALYRWKKIYEKEGPAGLVKGALKGFSNDVALGIASCFIPGAQLLGFAQLGLWGANECTGCLDSKYEKPAQQHTQQQHQRQFPQGSPGYW